MLDPGSGSVVDFDLVNGGITLDLPLAASAMLQADVVNGTISVTGLTLADAVTTPRSVHGRLGAGDGLKELDATNGTIVVMGR